MHDNSQLLNMFYTAFEALDAETMMECYAPDAVFRDEVFTLSGRDEVADMWRMLCDATRTKGMDAWSLVFDGVESDATRGRAHWEARYRFSATGRMVHNVIDARFELRDGLIVAHHDRFNFWRWSRQALGLPGLFLGWTPMLRNKVRAQAAANLQAYRQKKGLMGWLAALAGVVAKTAVTSEQRPLLLENGDSVPVRWVRDARARRLRLIVAEKGVRLTLPKQASARLAEQFLFEHRDWLQQQLSKLPKTSLLPFSRADRQLLLRDAHVAIDWQEDRYLQITLADHGVIIRCPARTRDAQLRSALRDFYAQQARADIGRWLPLYLPQLPRAPAAFRLRPLSSLWGSLAPDDAVSLDLSLVLGRPRAFEYVLVHELCHLLQRNHSRRYWREVESRCPDWREQRHYLHGEGLAIKAEMRRFKAG